MDPNDVRRWFSEYLDAFAACGRRLAATYLVTDGPTGRRISALVVHGR